MERFSSWFRLSQEQGRTLRYVGFITFVLQQCLGKLVRMEITHFVTLSVTATAVGTLYSPLHFTSFKHEANLRVCTLQTRKPRCTLDCLSKVPY